MIKSVFAATAVLSMSAGAAFAGPYVNVETNAGWVGDDYSAATTDLHVGYEGDLGEVRRLVHPRWSCYRFCRWRRH